MKKDPPHLPPRACRVDTHHRLQSLKWTIFLIFVAFISGTAAALSTVAWLTPVFIESGSYYPTVRDISSVNTSQPDINFQHQVDQKVIRIYDQTKKVDKAFYNKNSLLFNASILSSDGWVLAYYPNYVKGLENKWEAVDNQGLYYSVEKVVQDSVSDLLFIKIVGQGFRINSFSDWSELGAGHNYWAIGRSGWREVSLDDLVVTGVAKDYAIWRPQNFHSLWQNTEEGTLLYNSQGAFVGVVDDENLLRPAWLVEGRLGALLDSDSISYLGLPWRGYMVAGVEFEGKWKKMTGFYITEAGSSQTTSTVTYGDVIFKINNSLVDEDFLAAQLYSTPDPLVVSVWRDGKELEIEVMKERVF
ncbi:MAG: S1C family serine protease [Candidatus Magasanikbacteria bacterium]